MTKLKKTSKTYYLLFFITIFAGLILCGFKNNDEQDKENVLYISSYSPSFPTFFEQVEGIQEAFKGREITLDVEFMDSKRFFTEENLSNFYKTLTYRLSRLEPYDVIMVADDNAFNFAVQYQNNLFKDIPIVFLGVNNIPNALEMNQNDYITGVIEASSYHETIDLALKLNPKASNIVALTDAAYSGQSEVENFHKLSSYYPHVNFKDISLNEFSFEEFERELRLLDEDDIPILITLYRDKNGETITFNEILMLISENCHVPVYHLYYHGIGEGLIGGKVVSHYEQGKTAGEIVNKILDGTHVKNIPVIESSPNIHVFDYNMLREHNMDPSLIPKDAIMLNKEISFFERYHTIVIIVLILFVFMITSILILCISIKRRKKTESSLIKANKELIDIYEELESAQEELSVNYHELEKSKERYKIVFEATNEILWDFDIISRDIYFSEKWYDIFGEIKGNDRYNLRKYLSLIHKDDRIYIIDLLKDLKNARKEKFEFEYRVLKEKDDFNWIYAKGVVIRDKTGNMKRIAGSFTNIHDKKVQQDKIENLAYYDTLTGLPNRFHLKEKLKGMLKRCDRDKKIKGAALLIDLDNFKVINDTFGHGVGDLILKELGDRLKLFMNKDIFVARLSGDEFVILINNISELDPIREYVSEIQSIFNNPIDIATNVFHITTSIGITLYPKDGNTVDDILKYADLAMYKAKEMGRNCYVFFDKRMNKDLFDRLIIQNHLRNALKNNEFELYYQPQIDIKTNKVYGFEALIRWISPTYGFVPPGKFIKIAEEMGIIDKIGEWVLINACQFAKKINQLSNDELIVSVNISPLQLVKNDFVDQVKQILQETRLRPTLLGLEITETALMNSFKMNARKLNMLKQMGIGVFLDDFGTGYSSLNYLRQLPINKLKIDKSFIDDLINGGSSTNLTENIIIIAHKIGLEVVAEGVEAKEQLEILSEYGCNFIQGYYISKPLPEVQFVEFLEEREYIRG